MNSSEGKIVFKLILLIGIIACVSCNENSDKAKVSFVQFLTLFLLLSIKFVCFLEYKQVRRGIILRCQGNPVSCYGKRSSASFNDENLPQEQMSDSDLEELNSQEITYERQLEKLIRNCKLGVEKSCYSILKIMLMNTN